MPADIVFTIDAKGNADRILQSLMGNLGKVGRILNDLSTQNYKGALIGGIDALIDLDKQAIKAAADSQEVISRLTQTLESTGRVSEISAEQLGFMADSLMRVTTFDDEEILNAYNAIAKFGDIPTDAIDDITKSAADMAAALGGSLASNAEDIARLLETGLIPRSWGFNDALKAQVTALLDAGDKGGALVVVLDELNKRYGGQAQAQLQTYNGQLDQLKNNWENTLEMFGSAQMIAGQSLFELLNQALFTFQDVVKITEKLTTESWALLTPLEKLALLFAPGGVFTGIRMLLGELTTNLPGVNQNPPASTGGGTGGNIGGSPKEPAGDKGQWFNGHWVPGAANGADFWTNGPQMLMVGEGGKSEHVQVTPTGQSGKTDLSRASADYLADRIARRLLPLMQMNPQ